MSYKLRDTAAALLFLTVLLAGVLYLATGAYTQRVYAQGAGFRDTDKPVSAGRPAWQRPMAAPHRAKPSAPASGMDLETAGERLLALDDETEEALTDLLDRDHGFIEAYGLVQSLLGRRVMEDVESRYTVSRLSDGALSFADPDNTYQDTSEHAQALADFRDVLAEELGIPLLYVQVPQKASVYGEATLPAGLNDYGDAHANTFLRALRELEVDCLDLRPVLAETGRYSELFFRTDHHWTPEGAFLAWQAVAEKLEEEYGYDFPFFSTNPDRWERTILEDAFLGSQGKRVGSLYAGYDDFELWKPKGKTSFEYKVPIQSYRRSGSFEETLLFPERLKQVDPYEANPYTYYSGGDYPFARMKNLRNPDGPTVVLLRDSFACPFAPFMAMGCGELVTIDLRYFHDNLMTYLRWVEADMVVVLYSPGSLTLDSTFDFFYDPAQPAGRRPLADLLELKKPALGSEKEVPL